MAALAIAATAGAVVLIVSSWLPRRPRLITALLGFSVIVAVFVLR